MNYKCHFCAQCGEGFIRRIGRSHRFCSRKCNGLYNFPHQHIGDEKKKEIASLKKQGLSSYKISERLNIARNTVMKYW